MRGCGPRIFGLYNGVYLRLFFLGNVQGGVCLPYFCDKVTIGLCGMGFDCSFALGFPPLPGGAW